MDFDEFRLKYAETMMNYQFIEHDIKFIYAYMHIGDINKNFDSIENKTLGQMIVFLKDLDFSDNKPLISAKDYNFLKQICDNRNFWAHKVFVEFMYEKDGFYSEDYIKQCTKITKDCDRVKKAADILEEIRVDYCSSHRR